jgi:acyl-CoA thioesterase
VETFPVWGTADDLIRLMDVEPIDDGSTGGPVRFRTPTYPDPPLGTFFDWARQLRPRNVIEGGQLLGAVIVAASRVRPDLRVTYASITFAKAAHWDTPLDLEVDARRSGRSIAAFDVRVLQDGVLRATASVMSDVGSDDVIRHADHPPEVPAPADCPANNFGVIGRDYRVVDGAYQHQDVEGPPVMHVWSRFAVEPADEPLHQAAHAQASTHWAIATALRPYPDITEADAHVTVSTGPLSVAVSFHDPIDVTGWLLTETRSIYAGRGSSQAHTTTFDDAGRLVSSSTVQAMIRPFVQPPEAMGRDSTTAM